MNFIDTIKERAKQVKKTIVLPESMDARVMEAAHKVLEEGKDYTVEYKDNVNVGTATVIITGSGDYVGTIASMEDKGETLTAISRGQRVAMAINDAVAGKDFEEGDTLYVDIPDDRGIYHRWIVMYLEVANQFVKCGVLRCNYRFTWIEDDGIYRHKRNQMGKGLFF